MRALVLYPNLEEPRRDMATIITQSLLVKVFEIFEEERRNEQLSRIPQTLYKDVANYIKNTHNGSNNNGKSVVSRITAQEREMLAGMASRILEIRIRKILNGLAEFDTPNLTPEEKYIVEPLVASIKRLAKVGKAIGYGRCAYLETITEKTGPRYTAVRFLKQAPATMGTDIVRYGPFRKEDITFLPVENVRALLKQGIVQELDIEA